MNFMKKLSKSRYLFKNLIFANNIYKVRIIWILLTFFALIFLSEFLIVDPFTYLSKKIGLQEVYGILPNNWAEMLGDSLKRIIRSIGILFSSYLVIKYLAKKKLNFIGLTLDREAIKKFLIGLVLGILIQLISILLMSAFGWYHISGFSWQYHSTEFIIVSLLYTLFFCLETGVIEEVIFRGVLLNIFYKKYNLTIGVLISSVLFAVLHFSGFDEQFPWWLSILSSLLVALVFVQAYLLFDILWLPIGTVDDI